MRYMFFLQTYHSHTDLIRRGIRNSTYQRYPRLWDWWRCRLGCDWPTCRNQCYRQDSKKKRKNIWLWIEFYVFWGDQKLLGVLYEFFFICKWKDNYFLSPQKPLVFHSTIHAYIGFFWYPNSGYRWPFPPGCRWSPKNGRYTCCWRRKYGCWFASGYVSAVIKLSVV